MDEGMMPGTARAEEPQGSTAALVSLILGLCFFVPLAGLAGVIVGIVALSKISRSGGGLTGKGRAVAGIVLGAVSTLLLCCWGPALVGYVGWGKASEIACRENLRTIGRAIEGYRGDNDGMMPPNLQALVEGEYVYMTEDTPVFYCLGAFAADFGRLIEESVQAGGNPRGMLALIDEADVDGTGSYFYGRLKAGEDLANPAEAPIVWDKAAWHGGKVNVLWADYSVRAVKLAEFTRVLEENAGLYEETPQTPSEK